MKVMLKSQRSAKTPERVLLKDMFKSVKSFANNVKVQHTREVCLMFHPISYGM